VPSVPRNVNSLLKEALAAKRARKAAGLPEPILKKKTAKKKTAKKAPKKKATTKKRAR
jgi:hypothetical protein